MSSVRDSALADYSIGDEARASSGHKLGQLVGDWFQDDFVRPILAEVAENLGLYLDHRLQNRSARGEKILWEDEYQNFVDYDFVLELGGSDDKLGIPVAFLECFWRRGSRHSKDKARDDSGKLIPMRYNYPTARFLGIVASGDFTKPAMQLIKSREIDLLYVPKAKIVESLADVGNGMDYLDSASEASKREIADAFEEAMKPPVRAAAALRLRTLMTETVIQGYIDRVRSSLAALPQEIRISGLRRSSPVLFETPKAAAEFLSTEHPSFSYDNATAEYLYEVTYSDGVEFSKAVASVQLLRVINDQMKLLADHMGSLLHA